MDLSGPVNGRLDGGLKMANVHTYKKCEERRHNFSGLECGCGPRYEVPCSQCNDGDESCWRCKGSGFAEAGIEDARAMNGHVLIVHRELSKPIR